MTRYALAATLLLVIASSAFGQPAITKRAATAMTVSNNQASGRYWLFLKERDPDSTSMPLTEKGAHRRGKVDPVGLLRDERDLPVQRSAVEQIVRMGARVRHCSRWLNAVSVDATPQQMQALANALPLVKIDIVSELVRQPEEEVSVPRWSPSGSLSLEDPAYGGSLTQNRFVSSQKLHTAGFSGHGILIAMFDSGFNTDHPTFDSTTILSTWNFIDNDPDVTGSECSSVPQDRHGTGTLGAIGGYTPGSLIGTAYGADFILAKTEITCGGTEIKLEEDNWIAAAEWADSIGADIISSSLGYTTFQDSGSYTLDQLDGNSALITIAADIAASKNILVCNSAGNERLNVNWPTIVFPADGDSVLAVGATQTDSAIATFSSPGPTADGRIKPDVVSLGVSVYTANATGGYYYLQGTSLSTPLVAGGAALVMEADSTLTAMQLLERIRESGDRAETPDNNYGYGQMNAARAANICRVVLPDSVVLDSALQTEIQFTVVGRKADSALLTPVGFPAGAQLVLTSTSSGRIIFDSAAGLQRTNLLGIEARVGNFRDTAYVVVTYQTLTSSRGSFAVFPNPFVDGLTLVARGLSGSVRSVAVLNAGMEKVWETVNISREPSDIITIEWDGRNSTGQAVAPGVYLVCVTTDQETKMFKVVKVR